MKYVTFWKLIIKLLNVDKINKTIIKLLSSSALVLDTNGWMLRGERKKKRTRYSRTSLKLTELKMIFSVNYSFVQIFVSSYYGCCWLLYKTNLFPPSRSLSSLSSNGAVCNLQTVSTMSCNILQAQSIQKVKVKRYPVYYHTSLPRIYLVRVPETRW